MGLKIVTDDRPVKIIRKDKVSAAGNAYTQYSAMVASKDKDGNWHNGFIDVSFKHGVSVDNKAQIAIKNAFPVVSEYNRFRRILADKCRYRFGRIAFRLVYW